MNTETAIGLKVGVKQAEKTRKKLVEKKILRDDLRIAKDQFFVYFPVREVTNEVKGYNITKREFKIKTIKPKSYKDLVNVPAHPVDKLPTSFDVIGDIILVKINDKLLDYQQQIAEALMQANKNIRTVCLSPPITGELRTRKVRVIAGEKNTETLHNEYGLKFALDVSKTYFSPRLANERKRVASLVKINEIVVDMFSGVAPFSIMIANYGKPNMVYAVDKNKDAVEYAKKNIKINNLLDRIEIINADAKDVEKIFKNKNVKADRIIMNLPFSAFSFFKYALKIISDEAVIHYYDILDMEEDLEERVNKLKEIGEKNNIVIGKMNIRKIKTYSPREFYIGIDITTKKQYADVA